MHRVVAIITVMLIPTLVASAQSIDSSSVDSLSTSWKHALGFHSVQIDAVTCLIYSTAGLSGDYDLIGGATDWIGIRGGVDVMAVLIGCTECAIHSPYLDYDLLVRFTRDEGRARFDCVAGYSLRTSTNITTPFWFDHMLKAGVEIRWTSADRSIGFLVKVLATTLRRSDDDDGLAAGVIGMVFTYQPF